VTDALRARKLSLIWLGVYVLCCVCKQTQNQTKQAHNKINPSIFTQSINQRINPSTTTQFQNMVNNFTKRAHKRSHTHYAQVLMVFQTHHKQVMKVIPTASMKMTDEAIDKAAERFAQKWGFYDYKQEKPSKHIPYEHPALEAIRNHVSALVDSGQIHPRLIGNWDQVWTVLFEPRRRIRFKMPSDAGKKADPLRASLRKRMLRARLQEVYV
jgi:hypothetical protein